MNKIIEFLKQSNRYKHLIGGLLVGILAFTPWTALYAAAVAASCLELKDKLKGGKTGDKAIVRITEWPEEAKNPLGEVVDILGTAGDNNAEMNAILAEFDLPYKTNMGRVCLSKENTLPFLF